MKKKSPQFLFVSLSLLFSLFLSFAHSQCTVAYDDATKIHLSPGWKLFTKPNNLGERTKIEFQGLRLLIAPGTGQLQIQEISTGTVVWAWGQVNRACSSSNDCNIDFAFDGNLKMYYTYTNDSDAKMLSNTYGGVGKAIRFTTSPPYFVILDSTCAVAWPVTSTPSVTVSPRTTPVAGNVLTSVSVSLKALPTSKWRSSFGMNTHIAQGWPADQVYTMGTYMGVGIIRDRAPPSSKYPSFQRMADAGIKAMFSIVKPADKTALAAQVQAITDFEKAIPGMVTIVEGFNELDNFGFVYEGVDYTKTYAGMFKAQRDLYEIVKNTPELEDLPVSDFNGGCTLNGVALGCRNISGRADLANTHTYPFHGAQPVSAGGARNQFLSSFSNYDKLFDPSLMVMGETGYHTDKLTTAGLPVGITLNSQAIMVVNMILGGIKYGLRHTFIYEMLDEGATRDNQESNFGVYFNNRTPKPAATAFHFISELLNDTRTATGLKTIAMNFTNLPYSAENILFQHSSGKFFLVVYNTAPVYFPPSQNDITFTTTQVTLTLPYSTTLSVYDVYSTTADDTVPLAPSSTQIGNSITFGFGSTAKVIAFGAATSSSTSSGSSSSDTSSATTRTASTGSGSSTTTKTASTGSGTSTTGATSSSATTQTSSSSTSPSTSSSPSAGGTSVTSSPISDAVGVRISILVCLAAVVMCL